MTGTSSPDEIIGATIDRSMGILCRDDDGDELAVAHLTVARTRHGGLRADLCRLLLGNNNHSSSSWQTIRNVWTGHADMLYWETDAVVPLGHATLCFVDYLRGVLFCDVFSANPELTYMRLPVDPYNSPRAEDSASPSACRSLSVTNNGDALKFVDVAIKPARHLGISPYSTVNTWTLSSRDGHDVWVKDGTVEDEKLRGVTKSLYIPQTVPEFPFVDMKDPQTVYVVLGGIQRDSFLVAVNMSSKAVDACVPYKFARSFPLRGQQGDDEYSCGPIISSSDRLYSRRFFCPERLLPCEFSKYLGLDAASRCADDDTRLHDVAVKSPNNTRSENSNKISSSKVTVKLGAFSFEVSHANEEEGQTLASVLHLPFKTFKGAELVAKDEKKTMTAGVSGKDHPKQKHSKRRTIPIGSSYIYLD